MTEAQATQLIELLTNTYHLQIVGFFSVVVALGIISGGQR